jgi:hypothetical protein
VSFSGLITSEFASRTTQIILNVHLFLWILAALGLINDPKSTQTEFESGSGVLVRNYSAYISPVISKKACAHDLIIQQQGASGAPCPLPYATEHLHQMSLIGI